MLSVWPKVVRTFLISITGLLYTSCYHSKVDPQIGLHLTRSPASSLVTAARTDWVTGNRIHTLVNGDAFFPRMLTAVKGAHTSISFETFAFVDAPVTRNLVKALAQKAQNGLQVKIIIDAVGSRHLGPANTLLLRQSGVDFQLYRPINPLRPKWSNNRTHRKLLIIDGRQAFTGGAGHAHSWTGNAQSPKHWRDTMYQIDGPIVRKIQKSFEENWTELTGQTLSPSAFYPPLTKKGALKVQVVSDSPRDQNHPIAHSYLNVINQSQSSLFLAQSYFIPTKALRQALIRAAQRGVAVSIIVPGEHIDSKATRYASQNSWLELLQAGIRLFRYRPTLMHGKLLVADRHLSIIGSANLDPRSLFINDETNLHIDSRAFAHSQILLFQKDLKNSTEVTLSNHSQIIGPAIKRAFYGLVQSQL